MPRTRISYSQRKDGRLQTRIYIGTEFGSPKYKYIYAHTYKELEQKYNELAELKTKGVDLAAMKDTFGLWGELWLKTKRGEVSDKWFKVLENDIKKLDRLKNELVIKLRQYMLKEILLDLAEQGYSAKTLKTVKDIASSIMQFAVAERAADYNPFADVKIPKPLSTGKAAVNSDLTKMDRRALTATEQLWVRETPHRAQTAAMIMMYAGLRRGELIPLQWTDINLTTGTITVSKSVERVNNRMTLKSGGKTPAAERTIYIPKVLIDYLKTLPHDSLTVCTKTNGTMHSDSSWARMWDSYLITLDKKYGLPKQTYTIQNLSIPRFTAHWLRHTFITLMYLSGMDVLTAKEQAGHADIQTTLNIYTHLDEVYKQKNMAKLDEYLKISTG